MLVAGVLPAEIRRVRCLVAICSRVPVPKPKFFSGLVTNKPIWLCLIIITKAVQKNMHSLTVRHIESPHWPHRADRSLISLDKCMLREKPTGRGSPKLLDISLQAVRGFQFSRNRIYFSFLADASPHWPAPLCNLIIGYSTFQSFTVHWRNRAVCVCDSKLQAINTTICYHVKGEKTLNLELFFTLLIRKNQAFYSRTHSRWWKHSQFWLWRQRCRPRQGLHADMHAIRMIYANYAYYSQRNSSSNCQDKLPEISHKICRARSKRWRPLGKQGHSASGTFQVMMVAVIFPGCWGKCGFSSESYKSIFLLKFFQQMLTHILFTASIKEIKCYAVSESTPQLLGYLLPKWLLNA